jgi:hypothetical protein
MAMASNQMPTASTTHLLQYPLQKKSNSHLQMKKAIPKMMVKNEKNNSFGKARTSNLLINSQTR